VQVVGSIINIFTAIGNIVTGSNVYGNSTFEETLTGPELGFLHGYFWLTLFVSVLSLATGVLGVMATANRASVVALERRAIKLANIYYFMYIIVFVLGCVFGFIATLLFTEYSVRARTVDQQAIDNHQAEMSEAEFADVQSLARKSSRVAMVAFWGFFVICQAISAYFLYVVWSYKERLQAAADGTLFGPFVVKGEAPQPVMGIALVHQDQLTPEKEDGTYGAPVAPNDSTIV